MIKVSGRRSFEREGISGHTLCQRRVQNQDMPSLNSHFYTGDEEDISFLCVEEKVLVKSHLLMVGDGNYIKTFIGSFGDKLLGRVLYAVDGIFRCVKM